ncbi:Ger(x)C family spore germination protein [Alicyclobacillus sp. SO9]|uniref:Ger(x)C family spore germination protein n=1 Tax=Alicyclobacillus sp. SO9 TaxID=2665646 RepID=UPI0018E86D57|nr:Ger(x)C family spore germination protein [Alicyclobacillus sp. SO9]
MTMGQHTRWIVSALLMGILLGVPGCKDLREVDDLNIVLAVGIDETQDQRIRVTTEIVDPANSRGPSSGAGTGKRDEATITRQQTGSTIEEAVGLLDEEVPRKLFLAHNSVIIFGHNYATHGIDRALDYLERNRSYRRNQLFVVTDGTASDLMTSSVTPEFYHATAMRSLVEQGMHKSTAVNSTQLSFMKQYLRPSHTPAMARLETAKNGIVPEGIGLFDGGQYKDYLTSAEVPALLRFMQDTQQTEITIPCTNKETPQGDMSQTYRILHTHTNVTPQVHGNEIRFFVNVRGQAEISRLCPGSKPTPQTYSKWEIQLDHTLQEQMQRVFTRLQKDDVDSVHFSDVLYKRNPILWQQMAHQWKELFPHIQVTYDVQVQLLRHGLASKSPDVEYSPEGLPPHAGREGVAP